LLQVEQPLGGALDKGRVHVQGDIKELSQDTEIIGKYLAV